jgi:hypothetical protein
VLLRLAYLGVTNALAMLRLLPMSDRAKDAEILALRHQIMILERQLGGTRIQFTPMLIVGERHLAEILSEYVAHYNGHRPHRSLGQQPPIPTPHVVDPQAGRVHRRPILRGLINEYSQAA